MSLQSPYTFHTAPDRAHRCRATRVTLRSLDSAPPLETILLPEDEDRALTMFRDDLRDTKEIAWRLEATEAAVANGIARARDRERAR